MPAKDITDIIDLCGYRFRLHRATGHAAAQAQWAWGQVAGPEGAVLLAMGVDKIAELTEKIVTPAQRQAFAKLGKMDEKRGAALLGIVQCMNRGTMTPQDQSMLCRHFVLGWVDIETTVTVDGAEAKGWRRIEATRQLDDQLDGVNDAQIWTDLLWHQILHCLGPTTAAAGM